MNLIYNIIIKSFKVKKLHFIFSFLLLFLAMGMYAAKPASGYYYIKNVGCDKYMKVLGSYSAAPNAAAKEDASVIYVRVGEAADDGYKLISLKSEGIDVISYVDKGILLAKYLADKTLKGKVTEEELQRAMDLIMEYGKTYGYVTLEHTNADIYYLKAIIPTIPQEVEDAARKYGVQDGAWSWIKRKILAYLEKSQLNPELKALVRRNLDKITPGHTYYLAGDAQDTLDFIDKDNNPLANTYAQWKMEQYVAPMFQLADGYYRIKNAHDRADGKQYVQVTGKYQARPDQTAKAVKTQPGSIIQLAGKWEKNQYTVTTLRSQGVDAINHYLLPAIDMVKKKINQKIQEKLGNGSWANRAKEILENDIFAKWDLDMHLEKTTTKSGAVAYYAYATVPSMQPIVNFYKIYSLFFGSQIDKALAAYPEILTGLKNGKADEVWKGVEKYAFELLGDRFGADNEFVVLVQSYIAKNRINQGQTYYLMEGSIKQIDKGSYGVNEYVEGEAKFNFCNNNFDSWYGSERETAGDAAKWYIEPVTEELSSYFGIAPVEKMKGKNGNYFATLYTDFPMKMVDNMKAYIVESIGTTGAQKGYAQCKKIASKGEIIPAGTPVVLECETTQSCANRLLPIIDSTPAPTENKLKGVFFNEAKTNLEVGGKSVRVFNINPKTTARNPLGFYRYSGTTIKGNRAFLLIDANTSGAKLDGYDMEDEGTVNGIDEVTTTTVEVDANAVYYDLQGRRVDHPVRGIYIVNGKKVIIK